jgi:hypothetical protein
VEHTTTENCYIPRVYNNGNRTWEIKIILHRFGLTDNPKCPCEEEEEQTTNHSAFHSKTSHNQRNEMIKQIKHTSGNWPKMNEMLVSEYLQIFVKFMKSIDFQTCSDTLLQMVDRSQRMYVNIFNHKFSSQNIIIDVIMNLHCSL